MADCSSQEVLSIVYSGPMVELIKSCRTSRVGPRSRHSVNRLIISMDPRRPIKQQLAYIMNGPIVLRPGTVLFIFLYFTPCLTFSLRLMVTHRLDSCDHLLYRLVT